jgi:hypothetical protein
VASRNLAMGVESMMCFLVGMWWMAGTVYLSFSPVGDSPGSIPLVVR